MAWSPDGKMLAAGSRFGMLRVWDLATVTSVAQWAGHLVDPDSHDNTQLVFSKDSKTLVSAGPDGFCRQWDPRTGRKLQEFSYRGKAVGPVPLAFSPRGEWLAIVDAEHFSNGPLKIWDTRTGKTIHELQGPFGSLYAGISFFFRRKAARYGQAGGTDGNLAQPPVIWDVRTGKSLGRLKEEDFAPNRVAFSKDGQTVVSADYGADRIQFWDAKTGARQS